jgi:3-hydroxyacyl-CoA dehydrogenase/enoyl-CoA hydratase/3-hydroxybutyryl-CoA epimerase
MTDEWFGDAWRLERRDDGRRILWFDRPGASQNSLDRGALAELLEAVKAVEIDRGATILVLRSGKAKGFCAGADLKQFVTSSSIVELNGFGHLGIEVFDRLEQLTVPTVAVIHGPCLGGGLELALACRDRLAIEGGEARFGLPEVNLSLIPGWDAIGRLPRLIGLEHALDLLVTGRMIDVEEANRIGLVDAIVAPDRVESEIEHLAKRQGRSEPAPWPPAGWDEVLGSVRERVNTGPEEHRRAREILLDVVETDLLRGRDAGREGAVIGLSTLAMSPEAREAIERFFQRPPKKG